MADSVSQPGQTPTDSGVQVSDKIDLSKLMLDQSAAQALKLISTENPASADKIGAAAQSGLTKSIADAANQSTLAQSRAADATATKAQNDALVLQLQQRNQRNLEVETSQFTGTLSSPDQITSLATAMRQKDSTLDSELADITKRQHNGIFDNPIQWIYDQFALPVDTKAYNDGVAQRNALASQYDTAVASGTDAAQYIKATHINVSAEQLEAESKAAVADANQKIAASQAVLSQASIPYMQMESQLVSTGVKQRLDEANYQLQSSYVNSQLKTADMQRQLMNYTLTDRTAQEHAINVINAKTGQNYDYNTFLKLPPQVQEAYNTLAIQAATGTAFTPMQMYSALQTANAPIQNQKTQQLFVRMQNEMAAIASDVSRESKTNLKLATPEAQKDAITQRFNASIEGINNRPINDSDIGNGMPSFGELHASSFSPGLEQVPLWNDVLKNFATNPETKQARIGSQQLLSYATSALQKKQITPDQFADQLSTIGSSIAAFNTKYTDAASLGAPPQTKFLVNTPQYPGRMLTGGNVTLDLTDRTALKNFAQRLQSSNVFSGVEDAMPKNLDNLPFNVAGRVIKNNLLGEIK